MYNSDRSFAQHNGTPRQHEAECVCLNERWQTATFLFIYRKPLLCKKKQLISAGSPLGGLGLGESLCFTDLLWSSNEEGSGKRWRHFRWRLKERTVLRVWIWLVLINEKHQLRSRGAQLFKSQSTAYIICVSVYCRRPLSPSPGWVRPSERANGFWLWWIEKVIVSREAELMVLWLSIQHQRVIFQMHMSLSGLI